jgi:tetratricopeptide (TPR) repeat protein
MQGAMAEYRAVIRIRPDYAEAYNDLGILLVRTGRVQEAIAEYQQALRIKPDYADAHFNLGNALSKIPGRSAEAIAEYQAAARVRPDYANLASERIRDADCISTALRKMNWTQA